jgi:cell division protein FtsB
MTWLRSYFKRLTGNARIAWLPMFACLLVIYCAYHASEGKSGLRAYFRQEGELKILEVQAAQLAARKAQLENQKQLLSANHLDPDMLDEMARRNLGFVAPNEQMLQMPEVSADTKL